MILRSRIVAAGAIGVVTIASVLLGATGARAQSGDYFDTFEQPGLPGFPNSSYLCVAGVDYQTYPGAVESAENFCEYRVYMQYSDGSSFCINPDSYRSNIGEAYWYPIGIKIGDSTSNC